MRKLAVLFSVAALAFGASAFINKDAADSDVSTGIEWMTDFDAAMDKAEAEDKEVLLFFTGSDWCGWCKRFQADVLQKEAFIEYANENLVCVELDFPKYKAVSADLRSQNNDLQRKYGVRGYPSFRLIDADETLLVSLDGYQQGGPEGFINTLKPHISMP